jgi:4'-phosphopantetheinyl transferase
MRLSRCFFALFLTSCGEEQRISVSIASSPFDSLWCPPPERLTLDSSTVHAWRASLDQSPSQVNRLQDALTVDERSRAGRFYFRLDREHFVVARGILRTILGRYLNRAPASLSFTYGFHGKPSLASEPGAEAIRFNISHSYGTAIYVVTRGRQIGVDLELIRDGLKVEQIAERFFSRREISRLYALPAEHRKRAFFLCWTRKEAYIKARGEGLSLPLDQFEVSLVPGEPAALVSVQQDSNEAFRWSLEELFPAADYAAALAVVGRDWSLACWQWQPSYVK